MIKPSACFRKIGPLFGLALGVGVASMNLGRMDAPSASAQPAVDLHGATPMGQQEKALSELGIDMLATATPPNTAPEFWLATIPKDNELTAARVELGRRLYFDTRLSADNSVSCATCHDVERSFTDLQATSEGIHGQRGKRNAPTTMNAALLGSQFWDGRAKTVDDQALMPILNPVEMGMPNESAVVAAIAGDAAYPSMFKAAYGRDINYQDIGRAIGAFERTLIFLDSPADHYLAGDAGAISAAAKRGWILYNGRARCASCHPLNLSSPLGSDNRFHNVGVSARHQDFEGLAKRALDELRKDSSARNLEVLAVTTDLSELGRFMVSKNYSDIGAFRTPQVRNAAITGPYMHDGSLSTLWDVMDHYNKGGEANPYLDGGIEPLGLSEDQIDDVVAFLFTLTDLRFTAQNNQELERQRDIAAENRPFRDDDLAHHKSFGFDPRKK